MLDVITKCWDANPLKRPNADELHKSLENFRDIYYHYTKDPLIHEQFEKEDEIIIFVFCSNYNFAETPNFLKYFYDIILIY